MEGVHANHGSRTLERWIKLGYLFGVSLVLASIMYFFASNWQYFTRPQKLSLSVGLTLLFYVASMLTGILAKRKFFLARILLVGGSIAFGATLALIGQLYNSHADSFWLFLIWSLPALLFAIATRYLPFYIISFILLHLASGFYIEQTTLYSSTYQSQILFLILAVLDLILYKILKEKITSFKVLKYLAFATFHGILLVLALGDWSDPFVIVISLVYGIFLLVWLVQSIKSRGGKGNVSTLLGSAFIVLLIGKFFSFIGFIASDYVYFFTIVIPVVLVAGVQLLVKLKKINNIGGDEGKANRTITPWIIVLVSSIIAAVSLLGILYAFFDSIPTLAVLLFAIVGFILPALYLEKWAFVPRYTFLLTGLFIAVPAIIFDDINPWSYLFIILLALIFWRIERNSIRYLVFFVTMLLIFTWLLKEELDIEWVFTILTIINVVIFIGSVRLFYGKIRAALYYNGYFYGILFFFILTFFGETNSLHYFIINALYFLITTYTAFYSMKRLDKSMIWISLVFWFMFIAYKYYDLLWSLLNKSVTFMLLGLVFLAITFIFENRQTSEGVIDNLANLLNKRKYRLLMSAIVILQLAIIGIQVGKSEWLLNHGRMIELALEPIEPRSLMQGDYIQLTYTISQLDRKPEPRVNQHVRIPLVKGEEGLYKAGESIKHNDNREGTVWIQGQYVGDGNYVYGIENYFVPEGQGDRIMNRVKVAKIIVSKNGDAILVGLK